MSAGRLRERVTLQQRDPAAVPNAYNELPDSWVNLIANEPAEVYAFASHEFTTAQQVATAASHRVLIRTPTRIAILTVHRFVWVERLIGGTAVTHYLDVKQVAPLVTRRGYTECVCLEHIGG